MVIASIRHPSRVLVIDGDRPFAERISAIIGEYFNKRSIHITVDWVPSIERALLQMKYFEYDIAVVGYRPAEDESALDFLEIAQERNLDIPAVVVADPTEESAAEESFRLGAADFFLKDEQTLARLPEAVDSIMLQHRASVEYARLYSDLMEKNREMKTVNETLARQSVRFLKLKKEQESQRHRMELLLNAIVGGVLFLNGNREVEMLNPAARRIFHLDESDPPPALKDLIAYIGFNPFEEQTDGEIPAVVFSRDYRIYITPIPEGDDRIGRMLFFNDVTRDREVEKLKAEFQSMISHELRTPLTAIQGAVDNFLRGTLGPITEQQEQFLNLIKRNVQRQTELISDMLDLAKLEARMMSLNITRVDPEYLARLSCESFKYAYLEKGVELTFEADPVVPKITADERMLSQILDNLLSNALKFTPKGGAVKVEVCMAIEDEGDPDDSTTLDTNIVIRVSDTGPGVPDHYKERVFESFYQIDSSEKRSFKGTGLGLAICRKMAQLHHGTITCSDNEGGGAVLTLTLPITSAARQKIVLIETYPEETKQDVEILSKEFILTIVNSGRGADKIISRVLPQLVLMDYHIPEVDGAEIFKRIKQNPAIAHIPVIFVSGTMTEQEKVRVFRMGAQDFIPRPYNAGEFLARVKRVVEGR